MNGLKNNVVKDLKCDLISQMKLKYPFLKNAADLEEIRSLLEGERKGIENEYMSVCGRSKGIRSGSFDEIPTKFLLRMEEIEYDILITQSNSV